MNLFAINSTKVCCQSYNTQHFTLKVKRHVLLFLTFFFLGVLISFGQSFSGTTGSIDDNNCPTTNDFTASVTGVGVLGTTNFFNQVEINITHTYTSDLEITLVAPGGATSVLLSSNNGGGGNDFTNTVFRADAFTSIESGAAPFTGDYQPEGDLSNFDGINADGTWTLEICDDAGQDVGTLDSWEITFGTEAVEPFDCTNPINPSPSCNALKVIVVLDESGSIDSDTEEDVEAASLALANALKDTGAQMAFVEFASSADIPTYGGYTNWSLVNQDFINGLNNFSTGLVAQYGDNSNTTNEFTNWEDAMLKVLDLNAMMTADIVLFMTDGNPNRSVDSSGNPTTSGDHVQDAADQACIVKSQGSHIFALGVGTDINTTNLISVTGPILDDGPGNPTLTVLSADYGLISSGDLTQCFLDIAQSGCNNDLSLNKTVYAGHDGGVSCDGAKTIPNPSDSMVTYCFTVSNDGDQTISNLDFSDGDIGIDENNLTPAWQTSLDSGEEVTYYYEMTFSAGQTFPFNNTADVTGETPTGDPLSDSSSAEVTEPLCTPPSLTTGGITVCSESSSTIDLTALVTSDGTVSYHNSQLDADNNENALTNTDIDSPSSETTYYVRSEVDDACYVTDTIVISVTQAPEQPVLECWQTATINEQTCEWVVTGEQPEEPMTACYEIATFDNQLCQWIISGEQPVEPMTACYETTTFNTQTCEWDVTGEQPQEPTTACYETATFNTQTCEWDVTGEQPQEPTTACYETTTFNTQTCEWDVTGEQPEEPMTACYETATFNTQTCEWDVTGEQPQEPTTACYETATFNTQTCEWDVTGEQPQEPTTACYETATFNTQTCEWEITGEQPQEPTTACYETATFNTQTCEWDVTGEQPQEPTTACYETATFNTQTCEWDVTGEQPQEPTTACYETATFNTQTCEWDVTGEQPQEPTTACYEIATFNTQTCEWDVTGEQPQEPMTACYETATFNTQTCEWDVTGEQPQEPTTACYEIATFNTQTCEWDVTGEQPQEPTTACYETATFNTQTCEWEITGEQPQEPTTACYETATFDTQICRWVVTGEQPQEPTTECYETATFNTQTCEWDVTGEQPQEPTTACYETATFNTQTCEWEITGEQPEEPATECYETATFNTQTCEWEITGEQPEEPATECYETATFNTQTCEWDVTGVQPPKPIVECYETTTFNTQTCEWDITGIEPVIIAEAPLCDEDFGTYSVVVNVSIGNVTSSLGNPEDNLDGTWIVRDIPIDNEVTITTSLDDTCFDSTVVESPDCICIELDFDYTDVTCFEQEDGSIIVNSVSEGATVTINGEPYDENALYGPGDYLIRAFFEGNDDIRCIIEEEITIVEPVAVEMELTSTHVTCYGADDGTITITSLSEGAYYTIKLNGIGPDLSGQSTFGPGTYVVEAKLIENNTADRKAFNGSKETRVENPCVDGQLVVIEEPAPITCSIETVYSGNVYCGSKKGFGLEVNTSGGVGNLTYSWEMLGNGPKFGWYFMTDTTSDSVVFFAGANGATMMVTVTDENGCSTQCELDVKSSCGSEFGGYNNYFLARESGFDFEMYPNPSKGDITIIPNKVEGNTALVEVFNLVGTKILTQNVYLLKEKGIHLNFSGLPSQVYYVKFITKNGSKIKKLVIDK